MELRGTFYGIVNPRTVGGGTIVDSLRHAKAHGHRLPAVGIRRRLKAVVFVDPFCAGPEAGLSRTEQFRVLTLPAQVQDS